MGKSSGETRDPKLIPHVAGIAELYSATSSSEHGLTQQEAARRLAQHGANALPMGKPPAIWQVLLHQFKSPLIYILAVAGFVSLGIGEFVDAGFIFGILLLNALIGGIQEWRAEKSSHALRHLLRTRATVLRDGESVEIDAQEVVAGDILLLESGNRVSADARLISAHGLEVDESLLTGESLAVVKDADWKGPPGTTLGDRLNMAFGGSIVVRGRARSLVVATGMGTVVGTLAKDVTGTAAGKPPLLARLERFTKVIGIAVLIAASVVGLIGWLSGGHTLSDVFMFTVALAVSAIPEGLPIALTVALAVATARMARRGVIVRKLAAVEGLGSCTLIASDKTGTLTCNELTVRALLLPDGSRMDVTGEGYTPEGHVEEGGNRIPPERVAALDGLIRVASLCNEANLHKKESDWTWRGDPTDVALLALAHKVGWTREAALERFPLVNQIPFEPERKYAATFHKAEQGTLVCVKGAPERVIDMCSWREPGDRDRLLVAANELATQGFRVLACAEGPADGEVASDHAPQEPRDLNFVGFTGMIDPLRPGVKEAVAACRRAGVQTTMVTGDHPVTALAISRSLGLASDPDEVKAGADLVNLPEEELKGLINRVRVFARVTPDQKLAIVNAAKKAGHFVAVTGDGVNDAPALRAANIGVAMGKGGTDVAREAAELVITDDNFSTIVNGVEEGRVAYNNVRNVIYFLVSKGSAEVIIVLASLAAGLPLPLLAVQLLWLNLVTNGIQDVALAFEPGEKSVLERPPRPPRERIFDRLMIERTLLFATMVGGIGFGVFWWMIDSGWTEESARNTLLLLLVLFSGVHVGTCRSETILVTTLSPLRSPILLSGAIAAFALHLGVLYLPPAQRVLKTQPVSIEVWVWLVPLALSVLVVMEFHKVAWKFRDKRKQARLSGGKQ